MKILAIETSCDETSIAILEFSGAKRTPDVRVLSHIVSSQVKLHAQYGGVVPNLAKREHQRNLVPILLQALSEARLKNSKPKSKNLKAKSQRIGEILLREQDLLANFNKYIFSLAPPAIDAIAVTIGPGLAPCLWVGVNFARALAMPWDKPIIPVNHMMGHFFSALVSPVRKRAGRKWSVVRSKTKNYKPPTTHHIRAMRFPAIALLVSGGHTELVLSKRSGRYEIIGETLDDAAGEAFDKVARILGLGYPGGSAISAEAEKTLGVGNRELGVKLPRPMIKSNDFNFSFSGLKTAVLYLVRDLTKKYPLKKIRPAIAKEFQQAVVDVLVTKTIRAAREYRAKTILLGGGVAANDFLRERLAGAVKKELPSSKFQVPSSDLTGDNAFMIGLAAYFSGKKTAWTEVHADANLSIPSSTAHNRDE